MDYRSNFVCLNTGSSGESYFHFSIIVFLLPFSYSSIRIGRFYVLFCIYVSTIAWERFLQLRCIHGAHVDYALLKSTLIALLCCALQNWILWLTAGNTGDSYPYLGGNGLFCNSLRWCCPTTIWRLIYAQQYCCWGRCLWKVYWVGSNTKVTDRNHALCWRKRVLFTTNYATTWWCNSVHVKHA